MTTLTNALAALPETTAGGSSAGTFHVAIIMDGNGRWAQRRGLPRSMGHYYGAEAARRIVRAAGEAGVTHLTLFGFSSENWRRPKAEVDYLMGLLRGYLRKDVAELNANKVRLGVIGERAGLPGDIVTLIGEAEKMTAGNSGLHLTIALNYGGRADLAAAARHLATEAVSGRLDAATIDEAVLAQALPSGYLPDPDLLIRTSGERRISNFLLWQLAYAEMLFVDRHWPEFSAEDFVAALAVFRGRDRRFGGVGQV
ncbi:polyprenyl diphosphate synthase [Dongia sp.]|uniref:polyprenyl diphosphate synthase n=1 Tax=Dongia sp. TaxID=1977262 RepID=UPI0035AE4125